MYEALPAGFQRATDKGGGPCGRFFPESYERFIGIYWGQVSTPFCAETVESSDAYIFAGPIFNDYTRCGT